MKRTLGTCYYPEHWSPDIWAGDARRMAEAGLTWVRIGEFAWGRLEPQYGRFEFGWLDAAIATLGGAGLQVVLGTPTATPPRWMLDRHPDMLAHDADGRPRKFGSRRHYCFSHQGYRAECARIVSALARRYGANPHIHAWQTDNEYGCHDTTYSYSPAAQTAFRGWLHDRYGDIGALNTAWGNVFWSMEYDSFDQIDLPNLTVTEPNPSHRMDFFRFSSDQVASFNRLQAEIIRARSDAPILHNYMGRITDFDHYKLGDDLDIAGWDSYPLGFLEDRVDAGEAHKSAYMRQGDPDFQAFHHDLYRTVGKGRLWVMEQQPGPVNWAPHNPAPLPGMVRLWTWEAFAHGAEAVCYFRWRQAPFAQEQMHSGLLRPDSVDAPGLSEARQVAAELAEAPEVANAQAPVAIIFDYEAEMGWHVQPQGQGLTHFSLVFDLYRAMRKLGLSVDILPPTTRDFSGYRLVAAPGLLFLPEGLAEALTSGGATVLIGPRTGAKTQDFRIPAGLPPAIPGLPLKVTYSESLRPGATVPISGGGGFVHWQDHLETSAGSLLETVSGDAALVQLGKIHYLAGWPDAALWHRILNLLCNSEKLHVTDLPDGLRVRDTGTERFLFNYSSQTIDFNRHSIKPAGVVREPLRKHASV